MHAQALQQWLAKTGTPRADLWVTSKVLSVEGPGGLAAVCDRSLEALGVGYFDLYLIHAPCRIDGTPFARPLLGGAGGSASSRQASRGHICPGTGPRWRRSSTRARSGAVCVLGGRRGALTHTPPLGAPHRREQLARLRPRAAGGRAHPARVQPGGGTPAPAAAEADEVLRRARHWRHGLYRSGADRPPRRASRR